VFSYQSPYPGGQKNKGVYNMNKKLGFAVVAIVFIFGLILAGCADSKGDSAALTVKGVQVYTLSSGTFQEYAAPVTTLTVTGMLTAEGLRSVNEDDGEYSIGNIGTISADGKLTLNLPSKVEDGKLFLLFSDDKEDIPEEAYGFRFGRLVTTPYLSLVNSDGEDTLQLEYLNKTLSFDLWTKGWVYLGRRGIITDLSSYKWVINNQNDWTLK
jgi:hypothetical protein